MKSHLLKNKNNIYSAILKYGHSNFSLEILEYCKSNLTVSREQYYLDTMNPEYNIMKIACGASGYKHNMSFSINLSKARRGKKYNKNKMTNQKFVVSLDTPLIKSKVTGPRRISVEIFDKENHLIHKFSTIADAAKYINVHAKTIRNIYKTGISYDDYTYKFKFNSEVGVYDINNKLIKTFDTMVKTSLYYKIPNTTLYRYTKSGKLYKNMYYFRINSIN